MNGSMADTTNYIWNDNDGEEDESPRKGGRLRRFGIFFLVLAAVLGVVLVAAYRVCRPAADVVLLQLRGEHC